MSEWVEKPLGHLVDFEIGGTPSRDVPEYWADNNGNGHPWVSIADLRAGRVIETRERITDIGVRHSNVKLVKQGTLLMTFKLTIGEVARAGCDLFTNEAIAAISPKSKEISSDYLFHALPGAAKSAVSDAAIKGATLNKEKLGKIVVRFPSDRDCQLAIASILSAIDTQIEATEALIAKQARMRAGLMQDLFKRGVDKHGQLRSPREEAPHLYHKTQLGWLPNGWEVDELDTLVRVIDCKHYTPEYVEEGYPILRPRNVKSDGLDFVNVDYVSESDFQAMTDIYRPKRGDIIFSRNASFGVSSRVDTDIEFAIGQDVIVISEKSCDLGYVFHALQSDSIFRQIAKVSSGSTFGRINLGEIRKLKVAVAPQDERGSISAVLDQIAGSRAALVGELNQFRNQKDGLMQDLLTGGVSVAPLLESAAA